MSLLEEATRLEPGNPGAWRFLGIAYGKLGQEGQASMALAEQAILTGEKDDAQLYLRRAQQGIEPGDPNWIRPAGSPAYGGGHARPAPPPLKGAGLRRVVLSREEKVPHRCQCSG